MSNNTTANLGLQLTGDLQKTNFSRTHLDDNWKTVDEKYQEQLLKLEALEEKVEELSEGGDSASQIATNNTLHYIDDPNYEQTGEGGEEIPKVLAVNGKLWNPQICTVVKTGDLVTITNTETEETVEITSENGEIHWDVPEYGVYDVQWNGKSVQVDVDSVKVYTVEFPKDFSECTPQEIASAIDDGSYKDMWSIGDSTSIPLTNGVTLTVRIIGFDHDTLSNSENGDKAGLSLGVGYIYGEKFNQKNSVGTNTGGFLDTTGYDLIHTRYFQYFPEEWKQFVPMVDKITGLGVPAENTGYITEAVDTFLYSEQEIFGVETYSAGNEGVQYPYFATVANRTTGEIQWLRSPGENAGSNPTYCNITATGGVDRNAIIGSARQLFWGFCFHSTKQEV